MFAKLRKYEKVTPSVILKATDVWDCNTDDIMNYIKENSGVKVQSEQIIDTPNNRLSGR